MTTLYENPAVSRHRHRREHRCQGRGLLRQPGYDYVTGLGSPMASRSSRRWTSLPPLWLAVKPGRHRGGLHEPGQSILGRRRAPPDTWSSKVQTSAPGWTQVDTTAANTTTFPVGLSAGTTYDYVVVATFGNSPWTYSNLASVTTPTSGTTTDTLWSNSYVPSENGSSAVRLSSE